MRIVRQKYLLLSILITTILIYGCSSSSVSTKGYLNRNKLNQKVKTTEGGNVIISKRKVEDVKRGKLMVVSKSGDVLVGKYKKGKRHGWFLYYSYSLTGFLWKEEYYKRDSLIKSRTATPRF